VWETKFHTHTKQHVKLQFINSIKVKLKASCVTHAACRSANQMEEATEALTAIMRWHAGW
jgi:hypothetical protein